MYFVISAQRHGLCQIKITRRPSSSCAERNAQGTAFAAKFHFRGIVRRNIGSTGNAPHLRLSEQFIEVQHCRFAVFVRL